MNKLWSSPVWRSRFPPAIAAGLLLAAAFPKIGLAGFAWIAPGLMVACALGTRGWETFRVGYAAGLAYYLAAYYWLLNIPYRWHGIPFGPALGWLALSAYLALYPALWVWLVVRFRDFLAAHRKAESPGLQSSTPISPVISNTLPLQPGVFPSAPHIQHWWVRSIWCLGGAVVWVALEMVLARLFSGFPWDLLGVSQFRMVPLIQVASLTGVYGVSFLIAWLSLSLLSAALLLIRQPAARSLWIAEVVVPVLTVAILFNWGFRRMGDETPVVRTIRAVLIQPSIPQTLIWDTERDDERFRELLELSRAALTNKTDLLIWPEAAVPKLLRYDRATFEAVTGLARNHQVWMIIGADDAEPGREPGREKDALYFNSSFLLSPEGVLVDAYKKRSLVIFGEYVPLQKWLPFLKFFTPVEGGFTAGDQPSQFRLPGLGLQVSVLICFEDIFPGLGREAADPGTDLLVNLTNNGWFGESAAQWQHAATAVFRAVENGLPLVRCSNNGLTCWVDAHGRMRELFRDDSGSVYGRGFLELELPLGEAGQERALTFYSRNGDWFGWGCVVLTGLGVAGVIWRIITVRKTLKSGEKS